MNVISVRNPQSGDVVPSLAVSPVKGTKAIRFGIPPSVEREITSFDRGGSFEAGEYTLSKPQRKYGHAGGQTSHTGKHPKRKYHVTTKIRAVLGGKDAAA